MWIKKKKKPNIFRQTIIGFGSDLIPDRAAATTFILLSYCWSIASPDPTGSDTNPCVNLNIEQEAIVIHSRRPNGRDREFSLYAEVLFDYYKCVASRRKTT